MKRAALAFLLAPTLLAAQKHQFILDNDKDGDGKLSTEDLWTHVEWLKAPAASPQIIAAMDANGDRLIQKDEWWWGDKFASFDKNKDGALDKAELPKAKPQRKAKKYKGPRK